MRFAHLAAVMLLVAAAPATAQTGRRGDLAPEDKKLLADYRLSMPTLEHCSKAWKSVEAEAEKNPAIKREMEAADEDRARGKTLSEQMRTLETKFPNAAAAMKREGCPVHEFVLSTMSAAQAVMVSQLKRNPPHAVNGRDIGAEILKRYDFVPAENVAFYEQNKAKVDALLSMERKSGRARAGTSGSAPQKGEKDNTDSADE